MKTCRKCNTEKTLSDFFKKKAAKDGHQPYCKVCCKSNYNKWNKDNPVKKAFTDHKSHSKQRGIPFLFSFKQWVEWWGDDFDSRGWGEEALVMARFEDQGPYCWYNVKKITRAENAREAAWLRNQ